ncbi:unnamed protein product, partial [Brassica oleracea]
MKILPCGGADESKIGVEQVRECSKLLALHHSEVRRESRLRAVYNKIENGVGVALSAKSLLSAAPLSLCLSDLTGKE